MSTPQIKEGVSNLKHRLSDSRGVGVAPEVFTARSVSYVLDVSRYDVYVVYVRSTYHAHSKAALDRFLSWALPLVLEQTCGYRVFIHGRNHRPSEGLRL